MFEELKKINKQYYDDGYNEGNDKKDEETENIMNEESHKETRNQKIMFKVIIFVSVVQKQMNSEIHLQMKHLKIKN